MLTADNPCCVTSPRQPSGLPVYDGLMTYALRSDDGARVTLTPTSASRSGACDQLELQPVPTDDHVQPHVQFHPQVNAQAIYSNLTEQFGSKFDASASNLFAGGKAGLPVSATWQVRKFGGTYRTKEKESSLDVICYTAPASFMFSNFVGSV